MVTDSRTVAPMGLVYWVKRDGNSGERYAGWGLREIGLEWPRGWTWCGQVGRGVRLRRR